MDVFAGAVDAWLHPQVVHAQTSHPQNHVVEHEVAKGEETMTNEATNQMANAMIKRCAAGGPKLSQRDQIVGSVTMVVGALVLAVAYIVLTWKYHSAPAVQALGYSAVPAMFQLYAHAAYLRRRPMSTQVVVTGGALAFIYLIMWGACEVAVRL